MRQAEAAESTVGAPDRLERCNRESPRNPLRASLPPPDRPDRFFCDGLAAGFCHLVGFACPNRNAKALEQIFVRMLA